MHSLLLLRHGESTWNRENRFTGWTDVDLSDQGIREAEEAAAALISTGLTFDIAFTSLLRRAVKTLWIVMERMDLMWVPVVRGWQLNERHYGALQGLNKGETAAEYGEAQVQVWRRSYDVRPPALDRADPRWPGHEVKYRGLPDEARPLTESLQDTVARVVPYWEDVIAPQVRAGKQVVLVAHGNSLRALVKHLDRLTNDEVVALNIPTGIPLVYELDDDLHPIRHFYLGDPDAVKEAEAKVAGQGKSGRQSHVLETDRK